MNKLSAEDIKNLSIAEIRKLYMDKIAEELCSVQPMSFYPTEGKSEQWLIENGYEPVDSQTRLMWVKKS